MSRHEDAVDLALQRMLEADDRKSDSGDHDAWASWQGAAADHWVLTHPGAERYRRDDPERTRNVEEMRDRASQVAHAMEGVPSSWRVQDPTREKAEYLAQCQTVSLTATLAAAGLGSAARREVQGRQAMRSLHREATAPVDDGSTGDGVTQFRGGLDGDSEGCSRPNLHEE